MTKNILISGASSGIGKAIGEYLTDKGHKVIGTSRNPDKKYKKFELISLDVTDDESVKRACKLALEKLTRIDVLINNAGFGIYGPIEQTSIEDTKSQFETNYFGVVRMTNEILPHFKSNHNGGLIINISSLAALIGLPFQGHYSASKFALEGYIEALRMELKPFNIKACNINPADFKTEFSVNRRLVSSVSVEYNEKFNQFLRMYEREENDGANPILISKLIDKLINQDNIKVRYLIGRQSQTIGFTMKRLLGSSLFEKMMSKMWNV
ncbi:SDR family oxidoreductase [Flavobacterium sp.]|jgi:short-subunit dehydrogenase|uniref:SDR family oxidoreductase n=1 Tax=Flavobacterium sp. TaxID=239 RepID=UPI0037C0B4FC